MKRVTDKQIAQALIDTFGVQTAAANKLGVSRSTITRAVRRSQMIRDAQAEGSDRGFDLAESKLYIAIHEGQPWAVKTFLQYRGASRGYRETQDVAVTQNPAPSVADIPTEALERIIGERNARKQQEDDRAKGGKG